MTEEPENSLTSCLGHVLQRHRCLLRCRLHTEYLLAITDLETGCVDFGSCIQKSCLSPFGSVALGLWWYRDIVAGNMMEEAADLLEAKRGRDDTLISLMPSRPDGGLTSFL